MTDILMIDETRSLSNQGRVEMREDEALGLSKSSCESRKTKLSELSNLLISGSNDDRGAVCIGHKFN